MMGAQSSPATEAWTRLRLVAGSSPRTDRVSLAVPGTPEEAEALLSRVETLANKSPIANDLLPELVRFLGANARAWTPRNRTRLRSVIASFGGEAIDAIVAAIRKTPRTDILDDAELVLRALPGAKNIALAHLVAERSLEAPVRACLLRALARSDGHGAAETVQHALHDPEPELRDAAAGLVAELGLPQARAILERRLDREPIASIQKSIRDALAELGA